MGARPPASEALLASGDLRKANDDAGLAGLRGRQLGRLGDAVEGAGDRVLAGREVGEQPRRFAADVDQDIAVRVTERHVDVAEIFVVAVRELDLYGIFGPARVFPRFGSDAIWWSFPLGTITSAVLTGLYYKYGGWCNSRMIEPVRPPGAPPLDGAHAAGMDDVESAMVG